MTPSSQTASRSGFTLIEVLASMAVLIMMVLLMAQVFAQASNLWGLGTKRVENANAGRSVLQFMVDELSMAAADDRLNFWQDSNNNGTSGAIPNIFGGEPDVLYFVSLNNRPESDRRHARQVRYEVRAMKDSDAYDLSGRFRLMRYTTTDIDSASFKAYEESPWYVGSRRYGSGLMMDNIAAFETWAYEPGGDASRVTVNAATVNYQSINENDRPPLFLDLIVAFLSEADSIRAASIGNLGAQRDFVDRNSETFQARVYFRQCKASLKPRVE